MPPTRQSRITVAQEIPRAPWDEVLPEFMERWEQGQHLTIFGLNGQGKTSAAIVLLRDRIEMRDANACIIAYKPRDPVLTALGWPIVRDWPPTYEQRANRGVILWPAYSQESSEAQQKHARAVVSKALHGMLLEGGWSILIDEVAYLIETLRLRPALDELWNAGRSSGMTIIGGTQRPSFIPRSMGSQASWLISFHIGDSEDLKRVGEIMGARFLGREAEEGGPIASLRRHEMLIWERLAHKGVITKIPSRDL